MRRVKIKFCGMRTKKSISYAIDLGVDYLGFVVDYNKSPRSVSLVKFLKIATWLKKNKKGKYKIVAVTVDMPIDNIDEIVKSKVVDVLQLHGNENDEVIKQISGIEIWKAWNNKSKGDVFKIAKKVDKILLDSGDAMQKATNKSGEFNAFKLYSDLKKKKIDVVVSGGIDNDNLEMFLDKLKPETIDISRGIETLPGKKSKRKMKKIEKTVNDYYKP